MLATVTLLNEESELQTRREVSWLLPLSAASLRTRIRKRKRNFTRTLTGLVACHSPVRMLGCILYTQRMASQIERSGNGVSAL
jgi:hypothetical protein